MRAPAIVRCRTSMPRCPSRSIPAGSRARRGRAGVRSARKPRRGRKTHPASGYAREQRHRRATAGRACTSAIRSPRPARPRAACAPRIRCRGAAFRRPSASAKPNGSGRRSPHAAMTSSACGSIGAVAHKKSHEFAPTRCPTGIALISSSGMQAYCAWALFASPAAERSAKRPGRIGDHQVEAEKGEAGQHCHAAAFRRRAAPPFLAFTLTAAMYFAPPDRILPPRLEQCRKLCPCFGAPLRPADARLHLLALLGISPMLPADAGETRPTFLALVHLADAAAHLRLGRGIGPSLAVGIGELLALAFASPALPICPRPCAPRLPGRLCAALIAASRRLLLSASPQPADIAQAREQVARLDFFGRSNSTPQLVQTLRRSGPRVKSGTTYRSREPLIRTRSARRSALSSAIASRAFAADTARAALTTAVVTDRVPTMSRI